MVIKCWGSDVFEYKHIRSVERYGISWTTIEIDTINTEKYGRAIISSFNRKYLMDLLNEKVAAAHHSKTVFPPYK